MEVEEIFKSRLGQVIKEKNISMDLMSNPVCDTKTLERWLNTETFPRVVDLFKFCDYYGVSIDYLLGLTDDNTEVKNGNVSLAADRIVEIIDEAPFSHEDIKSVVGHGASFEIWRRKKGMPKVDKLGNLCKLLGISADWVVGFTETKHLAQDSDFQEYGTCPVCGDRFLRLKKQIYCTNYCRHKDRNGWKAKQQGLKKTMTISQISQIARENGMTYGQYVAYLEHEKERKYRW